MGHARGSTHADIKLGGQVYYPGTADESGLGHGDVLVRHAVDGVLDVVDLIGLPSLWGGHIQAHSAAVRPCQPADGLEHPIQDRQGKVPARVGQPLGIVGAGSAAQRQETLTLQVRDQGMPLPGRAVADEVPGYLLHQFKVVFDQTLLTLR